MTQFCKKPSAGTSWYKYDLGFGVAVVERPFWDCPREFPDRYPKQRLRYTTDRLRRTSQEYPHFPGYPTAILISGGILFYGSPFKPVDPLNVSYFHFRWVLKLLITSQRCLCSHPVQIHDSNHTPCIVPSDLTS